LHKPDIAMKIFGLLLNWKHLEIISFVSR